jgi:uncharacterized protein
LIPLRVVLTLLLGAAGGAVCWHWNTPLPWMIGAMTVTTIAALAGLPVRSYQTFRTVMVGLLGVLLGSSFTPALLDQLMLWPVTLAGLLVYSAVTQVAGLVYFKRAAGVDNATAFFSASPGGLNEMTIMGGQMGGDERTIVLTHAIRILLVVFVIPIWFRLFADYNPAARAASDVALISVPLLEMLKLAACGMVGAYVGIRLRLPAATMFGPMIASAIVHMTGLTSARPPVELVSAAQVVMGVAVGCRFAGTRLGEVWRIVLHAAVFAAILLALAVVSAAILHALTGLPTTGLVLAYAPGGVTEMSLVALALAVDVAFVATHHAVRLFIVLIAAPIAFRLMRAKT